MMIQKKRKKKKKTLKIILICAAVAVVVEIIAGLIYNFDGVFKTSSSDSEYDDMMAVYDYGDGYYYDSNDNAVKKTPW